jgi:hypothetical protein
MVSVFVREEEADSEVGGFNELLSGPQLRGSGCLSKRFPDRRAKRTVLRHLNSLSFEGGRLGIGQVDRPSRCSAGQRQTEPPHCVKEMTTRPGQWRSELY